MLLYWLPLLFNILLIFATPDVNKGHASVSETKSDDNINKDVLDSTWKTPVEKLNNRLMRRQIYFENSVEYNRQRRDIIKTDDILGMAKQVAITVFILIAVSTVCCIVTTIYICMRCCCPGETRRKRNQNLNQIPQPIIIQTTSPNYHPQYYQQQAPSPQPMWQPERQPMLSQPMRQLENQPILPLPSAPPRPLNDDMMDRPPPYEKICAT